MRWSVIQAVCIMGLIVSDGGAQAPKPDVRNLLTQAEAAMTRQQYDRALELYGQAREVMPQRAEIPYNMGVAAHRQGDFAKAAEHLNDAMALAGDPALRQKAVYNLGSAAYAQSLKAMQGQADPAAAKKQLDEAGRHVREALTQFKRAMDADPADGDARANAEASHRLLKQLEEMQRQMEESQDQKQEGEGEQDQQNQERPEQNRQDQQQPQEQQNQGRSNQEQSPSQSQPESQEQPPPSERSPASRPQRSESEDEPSPQPSEPIEAREQESPQARPQDQGERPATRPEDGSRMTRQAAERLLQLVRDKERKRREQLNRREAMRYVPAEKDW